MSGAKPMRWEHVEAVRALHGQAFALLGAPCTPHDFLDAQALSLHAAHAGGDERCTLQISSWSPALVGSASSATHRAHILASSFSLADARLCLAREHGFDDWKAVERDGRTPFDPDFEAAVDALVQGEQERLCERLEDRPELVRARSPHGHGATLLHYAGSNGLETWRQQTPPNLPTLVRLLLAAGAEREARMKAYGGELTTYQLAETSAHPHTAGVMRELLDALRA